MAADCPRSVVRIVSVQGSVAVRDNPSADWRNAARGEAFCPGSQLRTGANSRAGLYLINDSFIRLDQLTLISFPTDSEQASRWLELLEGVAHFMSRVKRAFDVVTPYVNAGIEGTEFTVAVADGEARVVVMEGRVRAHNAWGSVQLGDGQSATARGGQGPQSGTRVKPLDAVQWTLYYPPVLTFGDLPAVTGSLQASLSAYRGGDAARALELLNADSALPDGSGYALYRASLALAVGRVEQARAGIEAVQLRAPDSAASGDALALQAVVDVVQNRPQQALVRAEQAVAIGPHRAAPLLARSYAEQALFDLDAASRSAQLAVETEPGNPLAWTRLSELRLMMRNLDGALDAARRAAALAPGLMYSRTVLGFADLINLDAPAARAAFEDASGFDQASPLPHLGAGLAMIMEGHLKAGRRRLEIAANLDPGNALIRSYLGKAYYEEKRAGDASRQFQLAKTLDPMDPTAWFYDAILQQTENRPVQALEDIQKALALNDNRAVYRSRLLLDEDQAARSASQAAIYENLGFRRLALSQSWQSLSLDPGNYSAHRLLSDAYADRPRHETARVSELLQAQLLQPMALAPVSPSEAQTGLPEFQGTVASTAGFNEFSPLFNRKRYALVASGLAGDDETRSGEIAAGGFFERGMISLGHYRNRTDGVRDNNDTDQRISNVFAQVRVTPSLSVQTEYRDSAGEFGDLTLRFDGSFSDTLRRDTDSRVVRLGTAYTPAPGHTFLVSAINEDSDDKTVIGTTGASVATEAEIERNAAEGQYISSGSYGRILAGGGYLLQDRTDTLTTDLSLFGPFPPVVDTNQSDARQASAYWYNFVPWRYGEWILGVDYANMDLDDGETLNEFNPKLGLVYKPLPGTALRLAALRTLKTLYANNQTLAPTQVAGFNQLYDNSEGSKAWLYGAGLDHRFSRTVSGGLETVRRYVDSRVIRVQPAYEDQNEESHTAYLYWTPNTNLAVSAQYHFENFERDFLPGVVSDQPAALRTRSAPLEVSYFHRSGLFARLRGTYVEQKVKEVLAAGTASMQDSFWIGDAALGYRLPGRLGMAELAVRNLMDEDFQYQSVDPGVADASPLASPYYPERAAFVRLQLWF